MIHSKGPNDDPWGHPLTASFQLLVTPCSLTMFCRLEKYDLIKLSDSSEKPNALSLFIMSDGCRESNALLMSVESIPINCSESTASSQSSVSLSKEYIAPVSNLAMLPCRAKLWSNIRVWEHVLKKKLQCDQQHSVVCYAQQGNLWIAPLIWFA